MTAVEPREKAPDIRKKSKSYNEPSLRIIFPR